MDIIHGCERIKSGYVLLFKAGKAEKSICTCQRRLLMTSQASCCYMSEKN